jgi:sucrose-6-phosphate hydrolase SacC (GH32 family)
VDGDPARKKWVWTAANGHYLVGTFDGRKFSPEGGPRASDRGRNFYAVQTYSDLPETDGRRIQVAWMSGGRYPGMPFNQQMSFPCELTLRTFPEGLRLCRQPVREIESLRGQERRWENETLRPGGDLLVGVTGDLFDIAAEIEPGDASGFGFRIRGEPIECSLKEKKITCLGASADLEPAGGRIDLRILVDRASLEVFALGGRVSMTSCFLPRAGKKSLEVYAEAPVRVVSLKVYPLRSAWKKP